MGVEPFERMQRGFGHDKNSDMTQEESNERFKTGTGNSGWHG